jgi:peptidoglycan/xylan/chitin deacetylase (PgdA/CDA1 family)
MLVLLVRMALLWVFLSAGLAQSQNIYLLQNQGTLDFFQQAGGDHQRILKSWTGALARIGQSSTLLNSQSLIDLSNQKNTDQTKSAKVLILPSAVVLSAPEKEAILKLTQQGWSIFGTWALGSRDEKFNWNGYSFANELFSVKVVGDYDLTKTKGWFLLPVGETPVTFKLSAGERIFLPNVADRLLLVQPQGSAQLAARGGDWTRTAIMGAANSGLVTFAEQGNSRRVFLGLPETAWTAAQPKIDELLSGALSWLKREPQVIKGVWPHPYQSAMLIEMDTEEQFANADNLMKLLEARQLTGTFYSLTSLVAKNADVVKRVLARHEMAFHADVHDGFLDLPLGAQEARMRQMQSQLQAVAPQADKVFGFRAPLEKFDHNTEIAARKSGLKHHAGSPASNDVALPSFSLAEPNLPIAQRLVVLPRTLLDDVNLLEMGIGESSKIQTLMATGANDIHDLRGFGLLSIHSQYFGQGMPLTTAFPGLLDSLNRIERKSWLAAASTLEQWWRAREQVTVTSSFQNASGAVFLSNSAAAVKQFKVILMLPYAGATVVVDQSNVQVQALDDQRVALVWPTLPSGASKLSFLIR